MKLKFNTDISKHAHKVMFSHMAITVDQPSLTLVIYQYSQKHLGKSLEHN